MKITMILMLGIPNKKCQLWKCDNGIGDIWYQVVFKEAIYQDKEYQTSIIFSKVENAYKYLELKGQIK